MRRVMDHGDFQVFFIIFLGDALGNMRRNIINDSIQLFGGIGFSTDLPEQVSRLILQDIGQ